MKRWVFLYFLLATYTAQAANVILMIGDGMGYNHLSCSDKTFSMQQLPVSGTIQTKSFDSNVTDSAAAATAYACGQKTKNNYLGLLVSGKKCKTIAEKAYEKGYYIGIISDDIETGATPSAFYAHTKNRRDIEDIKSQLITAQKKMDIRVGVSDIELQTKEMLDKITLQNKPFFVMIEGANIDVNSHKNDIKSMKDELNRFDNTVKLVSDFIKERKDVTLIVLADHETGGLNDECVFSTYKHTSSDVPLFAGGYRARDFQGLQRNEIIGQKIQTILFSRETIK